MADDTEDRRHLLVPALLFFGALVVLIAISAIASSGGGGDQRTTVTTSTEACDPDDAACRASQQASERPGIIPEPGSGRRPDDAGDPGGAAQLALFGALVLGLAAIITLVAVSARRARRRAARTSDLQV